MIRHIDFVELSKINSLITPSKD